MFGTIKKKVYVNGGIALPLCIGERATIFHAGGHIRTSPVQGITQVDKNSIVFETLNSMYHILFQPDSEPVAAATGSENIKGGAQ